LTTTLITEISIRPTGAPADHPELRNFTLTVKWHGRYIRRGTEEPQDWYSVEHIGRSLSRAGKWKHWVDRYQRWQYRFTLTDALNRAHDTVDSITIGGRTFAQWQTLQEEHHGNTHP
jgi:hypothetical protein